MQRRAANDVSLSLSRLPARDGRSVFFCHRNAGSGFKLLQGTPRWYSTPSTAGGLLDRGFCADCGSPRFGRGEIDPETPFMGIHASSLDNPRLFKPEMHLWTCDAQPWDHMNPDLPKFRHCPPQT
jgi:hypothetical protein